MQTSELAVSRQMARFFDAAERGAARRTLSSRSA
jgi:hypothetical protein